LPGNRQSPAAWVRASHYRAVFGTLRVMSKRTSSKPAGKAIRRIGRPPADADRAADATRANILSVAMEEFADKGLSGARVDKIAERTHTVKRMIYYYFGSKEGLYRAVLEEAFRSIRANEAQTRAPELPPLAALRRLVEFTFDYEETHPYFIRLVAAENIHYAEHLNQLPSIREINASAIETLAAVLQRGKAQGLFRPEIGAFDLHLLITSFCFFRVSNKHTVNAIFGRDLAEPKIRNKHKRLILETV